MIVQRQYASPRSKECDQASMICGYSSGKWPQLSSLAFRSCRPIHTKRMWLNSPTFCPRRLQKMLVSIGFVDYRLLSVSPLPLSPLLKIEH